MEEGRHYSLYCHAVVTVNKIPNSNPQQKSIITGKRFFDQDFFFFQITLNGYICVGCKEWIDVLLYFYVAVSVEYLNYYSVI